MSQEQQQEEEFDALQDHAATKHMDPVTRPRDPRSKPSDPGTKPRDQITKPRDPGTRPGTKNRYLHIDHSTMDCCPTIARIFYVGLYVVKIQGPLRG